MCLCLNLFFQHFADKSARAFASRVLMEPPLLPYASISSLSAHKLCPLDERISAVWAGNLQRAFPLWHPDRLPAVLAAIKAVRQAAVCHVWSTRSIWPPIPIAHGSVISISREFLPQGHIFLVFPLAFKNISGHNAKIGIDQQQKPQKIKLMKKAEI